jgi:hypothetical protein
MFSFTPLSLSPRGNSPRYPLDRRLGEPQSRSGLRGGEKILDPTGPRTPTSLSSIPEPVAIPPTLSRFLHVMVLVTKYNRNMGIINEGLEPLLVQENTRIRLCKALVWKRVVDHKRLTACEVKFM